MLLRFCGLKQTKKDFQESLSFFQELDDIISSGNECGHDDNFIKNHSGRYLLFLLGYAAYKKNFAYLQINFSFKLEMYDKWFETFYQNIFLSLIY